MSVKDRKRKAQDAQSKLLEKYGTNIYPDRKDLVEYFIQYLLLYSNPITTARKAFQTLVAEYVDWNELRVSSIREIADSLQRSDVEPAHPIAEKLKTVLFAIFEGRNDTGLEYLRTLSPEDVALKLSRLEPLEPWERDVIFTEAKAPNRLPLDPSSLRVLTRLGLFEDGMSLEDCHALLESRVRKRDVREFHYLLIEHAKKTCHVLDPKCTRCPLKADCDHAARPPMKRKRRPAPLPAPTSQSVAAANGDSPATAGTAARASSRGKGRALATKKPVAKASPVRKPPAKVAKPAPKTKEAAPKAVPRGTRAKTAPRKTVAPTPRKVAPRPAGKAATPARKPAPKAVKATAQKLGTKKVAPKIAPRKTAAKLAAKTPRAMPARKPVKPALRKAVKKPAPRPKAAAGAARKSAKKKPPPPKPTSKKGLARKKR